MKNILFIGILTLLFIKVSAQEPWVVPDDKKDVSAPFKFTDISVEEGKELFSKNCMQCHGLPAMGNFAPLVPTPGDPADEKFQKNTDGELFYKITNGRGLMLSFKSVLKDNERWKIISYLRSFNKKYVQPDIQEVTDAFKGAEVFMNLTVNSDSTITAMVSGIENKDTVPISFADIQLFVKRYFGNLPIGSPVKTSAKGVAQFQIPNDLPGDPEGNLNVLLRFADEKYGDFEKVAVVNLGVPTDKPSLTAKRAMWNRVQMAPLWIIFLYSGVVLAVWGVIFYVITQLYQLWKLGDPDKAKS